mmetsp:Transcript_42455/g.56007  ORF Transcript_42455/g.56007 Transcript_42455/m.56007 type:complete len:128 (+) Transcript_42455:780-1163(+)
MNQQNRASSNPAFSVQAQSHSLQKVPQKEVAMRNVIINNDWLVQPPDIQVDGNCNYEVNYLRNISNVHNVYAKRSSESTIMNENKAVREVIGRCEKNVSSVLVDSMERNTTLFNSQLDGDDARSLLR